MEYSALSLPDLTVSCETAFSLSYKSRPQLVSVLLTEFDRSPSPFFSGFEPYLAPVREKRKVYLDLAVHLLTEYEINGLANWKHDEQRKVLEKAIRLLDKAYGLEADEKAGDMDVLLMRGKAFLYRSRIIKPKELTVPGKKIQALEKALLDLKKSEAPLAPHYRGLTALEMDRCGIKPADLLDILETATTGIDPNTFSAEAEAVDPDQKAVEFYRMRVRLEELKEGDYTDKILTAIFSVKGPKLALEKLKVAIRMDRKAPKTPPEYMKLLLLELRQLPFSHPLWEDTVRFLRRINEAVYLTDHPKPMPKVLSRMESFIEKFPIDLWETADKNSRALSDIHLRWYWSRQRDLYDLAFLAAVRQRNFALAARIADSTKSRPALTWRALEQMSRYRPELKNVIEQYAKVLGGGYVSGLKSYAPPGVTDEAPPTPKVDAGQRIVQFYLVQLKGCEEGYAVICDENGWSDCKSFDFRPIWRRYLEWQTDYFSLPSQKREVSAPQLKKLCEEMGEQLAFLFNYPDGTNISFIPHDFLHRVPLHGAIQTNGSDNIENHRILVENHRCTYWPTLAYQEHRATRLKGSWIGLEHFEEKDKHHSDDFRTINHLFHTYRSGASPEDFESSCDKAPGMVAFFCHGKTDPVNPFMSRLKLKAPLTLLRLSTMGKALTDAAVFMGACETDLMPSIDAPLDEHLSPAAAFINKEASAVVGTMWEARRKDVIDILGGIQNKGFDAIFELQQSLCDDYLSGEGVENLHYGLVFKLYRLTV